MTTFVDNFLLNHLPKILKDLGEWVAISPNSEEGNYPAKVIFENNYQEISEDGTVINSNKPRITYKDDDCLLLARGDGVIVGDDEYKVENIEKDDRGISVAYLHRSEG